MGKAGRKPRGSKAPGAATIEAYVEPVLKLVLGVVCCAAAYFLTDYLLGSPEPAAPRTPTTPAEMASFFSLVANTVSGGKYAFTQMSGKVGLITNTASYWGKTGPHFKQLVKLHSEFGGRGLEIVGQPSQSFNQEAGTDAEVKEFAEGKGVSFTLLSTSDVNGPNTCPLYKMLKQASTSKDISWNFGTYFLVSRSGQIERHDRVSPKDLHGRIESLLAENPSEFASL